MAKFRLHPLIEFAEERSKNAAQELQRQRGLWVQAEEKLHQLESYLAEYRDRLANRVEDGMHVTAMLDFQRFIVKLELAIKAQAEEIVLCQQRWETAQQDWQERERELKAYHALRERHQREEQHKENRQEQRVQDEFAQNSARRRSDEDSVVSK